MLFRVLGYLFSSTVWAFEFVDFSAFLCHISGLAPQKKPVRLAVRRRGRFYSRRFSKGSFRLKSGEFDILMNFSFWATTRLANFSPILFELVGTGLAEAQRPDDESEMLWRGRTSLRPFVRLEPSVCEIWASLAGPAINSQYKAFHFDSLRECCFFLVIIVHGCLGSFISMISSRL